MNRYTYLTAAIAATLLMGAAIAAPQADTVQAADAGKRGHRMLQLDANGDGAIDRAEAAKMPRLAERFDILDRNGDGRLEAGEHPRKQHRRAGHGGGRRGGMEHGGMQHVLKLDTDADGRISKLEVADSQRFAERFDGIDTNRDGYLVRSELMASAERMRTERAAMHRARMDQRFNEADSDGDGKLSRAEVESKMPRMAAHFAFMDEDRDGFLVRADLAHPRRR